MRLSGSHLMHAAVAGFGLALMLVLGSCNAPTNNKAAPVAELSAERRILAQLAKYEDGVRRMDFDDVADLFVANGKVVNPGRPEVEGRELIRVFLKSFSGYKVIENTDHADSTVVEGKSAQQTGTYAQTVTIPEGDTVHVKGRFEAWWVLDYDGEWRLARMETTPQQ